MPTGLKSSPDDFDLRMSEEARPFYEQVVDFLERVVDPMQKQFFKEADPMNRWGYTERQLELLEGAKDQAKAEGLWNFFLPDTGQGLSNLDYPITSAGVPRILGCGECCILNQSV